VAGGAGSGSPRRSSCSFAGALATHRSAPDDELLATELARLERKLEAATTEPRSLADLYQVGLVELSDL
jgi:hypothetical protein